jgi:replicative DNA helicase
MDPRLREDDIIMPSSKKSQLKIPPQNLEAEQAVLGAVLIDKNAIFRVADVLVPADFYFPAHETIYNVILELYMKHQPIDVVSVTNRLKERETLKDIGGSAYLADLTNAIATSSHVEHYAKIVKDKKALRDVIKASAEITEDVFNTSIDVEDILDDIEQKILAISQKSLPQNFSALQEELKTAYERIENLHAGGNKLRGIPTGFTQLDNLLSGLQKSELIVIGGRPSLGKTALALDIARQAANAGHTIGFFSLEMSREEVIDRVIAAESQVPLWRIRTGRITDDMDFTMIQGAMDRLSKVKFFIDDSSTLNILQMRSMARRLQMEHGLDLLVVDYLQLIKPRTTSDNMVQQVTEISRGLKTLARELKVPVLALSQLSRGVEQRDHKVPRLSDLRESGSIEQDADVVMFIYRKDKDREMNITPEEEGLAQILIQKHRNGPTGEVDLRFDSERVSFKSIDKRHNDSGFDISL